MTRRGLGRRDLPARFSLVPHKSRGVSRATLMDDRRVMRNSGQERLMRRRGMNEAGGPERVDEPVNRIPVHGIAVDGARRYHSGQRYPPRLYLVRGGDRGGVRGHRMAARNRATTVHGTSPVLRHNWNSMTATTTERTRERAHGDGYTSMTRDEFKTVGRRSTTSVRSDPLRFFLAPRRDIDLFFDRINASFVENRELSRMDIWKIGRGFRLSFNEDN